MYHVHEDIDEGCCVHHNQCRVPSTLTFQVDVIVVVVDMATRRGWGRRREALAIDMVVKTKDT